MNKTKNLFIITGGPGSGKTAIINELYDRNYNIVIEGAREIIKDQMQKSGNALPWADVKKFRELCLEYSIKTYREALKEIK